MGWLKFDCKSREAEVGDFFSLQLQLAILRDDLIDAQGYFLQHSDLTRGTSISPHCHVAQKMGSIKYFCGHNSTTCIDKYLYTQAIAHLKQYICIILQMHNQDECACTF